MAKSAYDALLLKKEVEFVACIIYLIYNEHYEPRKCR